jgi:hypothetical protein
VPDADEDGFNDSLEMYVSADPLDPCPDSASHRAWPPDFVITGSVNVSDILALKGRFGSSNGTPEYSPIYDLVPTGSISIADILALKPVFGRSCPNGGVGAASIGGDPWYYEGPPLTERVCHHAWHGRNPFGVTILKLTVTETYYRTAYGIFTYQDPPWVITNTYVPLWQVSDRQGDAWLPIPYSRGRAEGSAVFSYHLPTPWGDVVWQTRNPHAYVDFHGDGSCSGGHFN